MLFSQTAIVAFIATTMAAGLPAPASRSIDIEIPAGLVVLDHQEVEGGTITTFGEESVHGPDGSGLVDRSTTLVLDNIKLNKRCGSNKVQCWGDNVPTASSCSDLIDIFERNPYHPLAQAPRSVCFNGQAGSCCVSWRDAVSGGTWGMLIPAARNVQKDCLGRGQSGFTEDTLISRTCTKQCLSNRPDGC